MRQSPEEENGGFGECPLEVCVNDILACSAVAFSRGLYGAPDDWGVGGEVLEAGESMEVLLPSSGSATFTLTVGR